MGGVGSSTVSEFLDLLRDNTSVLGRLVTTAVLVVVAVLVALVAGRLAGRRVDDPYSRYYVRKVIHAVVVVALLVALAVVWRPFAGRVGVVLGFATAGLAFAMQEVIGAFAGWVSILTGRQFRVGDRIQMGGVRTSRSTRRCGRMSSARRGAMRHRSRAFAATSLLPSGQRPLRMFASYFPASVS